MIDPVTMMALAKAGTALGKYAYNRYFNKQPGFEDTDYGKRLKQLSTEGMYNSRVRSNIIGNVAQQTANVAANTKADMTGRLINSGMEGSIAGQASLNQIDNARMGQIGAATQDIETKNELSKEQYKNEYAQAKQQYKDRIAAQKQANNKELVGGLLDAAGGYVGGKINQSMMKGFGKVDMNDPTSVQGWVAGQTDPAKAMELVKGMAQTNYYNQRGETTMDAMEAKNAKVNEILEKYKNSPYPDEEAMANELARMGFDANVQEAAVQELIRWTREQQMAPINPKEF